MPNFEMMNETDVREVIVRPLLNRIGYELGTEANLRTEVPLTYAKAFLGRKNEKRDPPLRGRADYVCDATSYGRWVVEVKSPNVALSNDDVQQAHTYSAHPEIAASHFMLTNGRDFRVYATGRLGEPLLTWRHDQIDEKFMNVMNLLGFDAFRIRAAVLAHDPNKPLAQGHPSRVEVVTGEIRYGLHQSNHPLFDFAALEGQIGQVTGGQMERSNDGLLHATLTYRSPFQHLQPLVEAMGLDRFEFFSADQFVSINPETPTIFQNAVSVTLQPGTPIVLHAGAPHIPSPFGFDAKVWTEATGFLEGDYFRGISRFTFHYDFTRAEEVHPDLNFVADAIDALPQADAHGEGEFFVRVAPVRDR